MPRKISNLKALAKLLDTAPQPVYVLDGEHRFVYGNAAFSAWVGRSAEELAGLKCLYSASGELTGGTELAAAIAPPPEAYAQSALEGRVAAAGEEGKLVTRPAWFVQLPDVDGKASCVLVVVGASLEDEEQQETAEASPANLHQQLQELRGELGRRFHIGQLIGQSPPMRRVREQVRVAAQVGGRVLVLGPEGSGRELVARIIHYGPRGGGAAVGPLVPVDAALMDAELMQSTLTAYLKRQSEWRGERPPAILLKDADRLPADAQQEMAGFLRLPGVELPLIATATRSLARLAKRGKFRPDLAYRLSPLTIQLPPLSEREGDLPLLAQFFLEEFNTRGVKQLAGFAPEAADMLFAYSWPGNVDELAEIVRQACEHAAGPLVQVVDLPPQLHHAAEKEARPAAEPERIELDSYLATMETELLRRAMEQSRGNKTKAAELLGIHRARLIRRLVQLGLTPAASTDEPVVFEPLEESGQQPDGK
ncbi:MAG: sigma 54-interacting transcriptional regulator [Pirellulaceae bacterium]